MFALLTYFSLNKADKQFFRNIKKKVYDKGFVFFSSIVMLPVDVYFEEGV